MRYLRATIVLLIVFAMLCSVAGAQNPPAGGRGGRGGRGGGAAPTTPPGQAPAPGAPAAAADARGGAQRGGRGGGGGGGIGLLTVTTTAWPDGGMIPLRYTQVGGEISPSIQWQNVPGPVNQTAQDGTVTTTSTKSFVIVFKDTDVAVNGANVNGTITNASPDGMLHWMVWNIPGTATNIGPGQPDGFELENGTRQISVSGSRYRGPGAPAAGPIHHYLIEVYALDTMLDIKVPAQGPQEPNPNVQAIRTQVMNAMLGHIRAKGSYVGLFHRPQ
jgi:phosphatidylethanolamine-binding protein (PEBP) family uncharacterized protein